MGSRAETTGVKRYTVYVTPNALKEIKALPGHLRQRVRRAVDGFAENPRPPKSKSLDLAELPFEVLRSRLDQWRIVYAVTEDDHVVDVLAVRKRPPYDYGDLEALLDDYPLR
jgi:mRNA interferase RelE/StbE